MVSSLLPPLLLLFRRCFGDQFEKQESRKVEYLWNGIRKEVFLHSISLSRSLLLLLLRRRGETEGETGDSSVVVVVVVVSVKDRNCF